MRKGIALLRASSKRQGKSGLGLDAQRLNVNHFACRNKIKIVECFVEVRSGLAISRPILDAVLVACKKHNAILLIANVDRLARRLLLIAELMESDIKFIAVDKPYASEYELHMAAANAQRESREISRRTREALQAAKKRGVRLGTSVYKLHQRKRKEYKRFALKLKPHIKRYMTRGYNTVRKLTAILNENNVKTFQASKYSVKATHWHISTVHRLLKELKYL